VSVSTGPIPLAHLDLTPTEGVSAAQVRAIWRAVGEARAGRFDALAVHTELVKTGYSPSEADVLVEEMVVRLAERQPVT
jgi:hypothetical protein